LAAIEPSCKREEKFDPRSGNDFVIHRCDDRVITIASNARTASHWQWTVFPDGSQEGINSCGVRWTYDAQTTVYTNTNGERRVGEGAFRERLASPIRCDRDAGRFDARLAAVRTRVLSVDVARENYAGSCKSLEPPEGIPLDSIVIGGTDKLIAEGRLLPPGYGPSVSPETIQACRRLSADIERTESEIDRELQDVDEAARRQGMLPGIIRDMFARHGFTR
jgi:hypothetical protein